MKPVLKTACLALVMTLGLVSAFSSNAAEKPKALRVLLVTGDDVEPAHNWREVSQAIRDVLIASQKFEVKVSEDAGVLDARLLRLVVAALGDLLLDDALDQAADEDRERGLERQVHAHREQHRAAGGKKAGVHVSGPDLS